MTQAVPRRVLVPLHRTKIACPNGSNRLADGDRCCHAWYRFVLSYPPHLVREYLQKFDLGKGCVVLDPFCGTGTTLVECKKQGVSSVGLEANPFASFATRVKTTWDVDPDVLIAKSQQLGCLAAKEIQRASSPLLGNSPTNLRTLPEDSYKLLLSNSISPLPLHKTLVLLDHINRGRQPAIRDIQKLALARGLVGGIGNLHFGPEVGVGPAKDDADVVGIWLSYMEEVASDLRELGGNKTPCSAYYADARKMLGCMESQSIDAVITSPPYPNEKDYTRTTRLESVILGFIRTKAELQAFKRSLMRSNTRNVYKGDDDDQWISTNTHVAAIADEIERRRIAMGKTSGFERMYARVTRLYFGGMARHLGELRRVLKPGGKLAYVVGDQASYLRVMIRTGTILADIAAELGYKVLGIDLFRTRLATATREQLREEVVLLEWTGKSK